MGNMTLITATTLTGSAASVTFSSIPQTYNDLVLRVSARNDSSATYGGGYIALSGDTGTNYSRTLLYAFNATAYSGRSADTTALFAQPFWNGNTSTANTFGSAEFYIPKYTSSASKPIGAFGVGEDNATNTPGINAAAFLWRNSSAVTSISLTPSIGSNFMAGSTFRLYGISNS